jgi:hypothetical protein
MSGSGNALIQAIDLTKYYGGHRAAEGLNFAVHGTRSRSIARRTS